MVFALKIFVVFGAVELFSDAFLSGGVSKYKLRWSAIKVSEIIDTFCRFVNWILPEVLGCGTMEMRGKGRSKFSREGHGEMIYVLGILAFVYGFFEVILKK